MIHFGKHIPFNDIKKVLLIRNDKVGDIVLMLPLATLLKKTYPHLKVGMLIKNNMAMLAKNHDDIDEVIILPDDLTNPSEYAKVLNELCKQAYDLAIAYHAHSQQAKLIYDAEIPYRLGNLFKAFSWRFNIWRAQNRKKPCKHELDFNIDLIRRYINVPAREKISFNLNYSPTAQQHIASYLQQQQINNYIIIHPGTGGSALSIDLPVFAKIINSYNWPGKFVITGSLAEEKLFQELAKLCNKPLVDATGSFNLDELMCLIAHCQLLISNSTGPLHLARAFNRKVLGFYSTVWDCHPRRWGPYAREEAQSFLPVGESYFTTAKNRNLSLANLQKIDIPQVIEKLNLIGSTPL